MDEEVNKCSFCGEVKPVNRQYLHAKNKEHINTNEHSPFTITYYCHDCGIREDFDKENFINKVKDLFPTNIIYTKEMKNLANKILRGIDKL